MYIYLLIFVGPRFCLDCGSTAELQVVYPFTLSKSSAQNHWLQISKKAQQICKGNPKMTLKMKNSKAVSFISTHLQIIQAKTPAFLNS